jgi:hypothetical protein
VSSWCAGGDLGDLLSLGAAAGENAVFALAQRVADGNMLDRLHQRLPHQRGPLFGDVPAVTLMSDSRWLGVSPDHEHNLAGVGNRVMSAISATSTAAASRRSSRYASSMAPEATATARGSRA